MKILYFTSGARHFTLNHIIKKSFKIVSIVVPMINENSRFYKSIQIGQKAKIPIIEVTKDNIFEQIKNIDFDVLISCGFSFILEKKVIELAKKIAINIHPTLLPKYRGYRSGPYIIINGEECSGITIHKLTEQMDKGDIIAQEKFELSKFDTIKSMTRKSSEIEPLLLEKVLNNIKNNKIKFHKQNEDEATTYNYLRKPMDSEIDVNKSIIEQYNFIRSCDYQNYPAFFYIDGEKVLIKLTRENKIDPHNDLI